MTMLSTHCRLSLLLLLGSTIVIGCGASSGMKRYITSYPDPDFIGHHYAKVAVHMETPSLELRQAMESRMVEEMEEEDRIAIASGSVIVPTRTWDSAAIHARLSKAGVDGYMRIVEVRRGIDSTWIDRQIRTTTTREGEERVKQPAKGEGAKKDSVIKTKETEKTTTTDSGGYMWYRPWREFRIELIDMATGRIAWLGVRTLGGSFDDMSEDLGERVTAQLIADGMVR